MGLERESFVGNPHKQDYIDDDEALEYMSGDDLEFNPFGIHLADPELILQEIDIITDDDYDPEDDYEDFLSDSDYVVDGTEESESDQGEYLDFSDSEQEVDMNSSNDDNNQENSNNKVNGENKSAENKTSEVKTNGSVGDVSPNDTDTANT